MLLVSALTIPACRKGKTAGLSSAQIDNLLVDFDGDDAAAQSDDSDSDSSDSDTFSPQREAMVEILDDFGRTRLVPRSEVPRDARIVGEHAPENECVRCVSSTPPDWLTGDDSANVRYGDQTSFPVYMPDLEAIRKKFAESEQPLFARYDAKKDNRTRAAGQYIFSRDEETRQQELDDLKQMRDETQRARAGNNADDTLARAEDPLVRRRRQETEERRRRIQQKRAQVMAQNV